LIRRLARSKCCLSPSSPRPDRVSSRLTQCACGRPSKPINSSGSRNVFFINKNKVNNLFRKNKSFKKPDFIVQDFIPGNEYMIDGLISDNKIHEFLISKKIKVKSGFFSFFKNNNI
jgi:hypothetical protein